MFFRAESLFQIDLETVGQVRQVAEHIGEFCSVIFCCFARSSRGPSALGTDHRGLLGTAQTPILIDLYYANINKISTSPCERLSPGLRSLAALEQVAGTPRRTRLCIPTLGSFASIPCRKPIPPGRTQN